MPNCDVRYLRLQNNYVSHELAMIEKSFVQGIFRFSPARINLPLLLHRFFIIFFFLLFFYCWIFLIERFGVLFSICLAHLDSDWA